MQVTTSSPLRGLKRKADTMGLPQEKLVIHTHSNVTRRSSDDDDSFFADLSLLCDAQPSSGTVCNCRFSKCSKMYCDCFASGVHCGERCGCLSCENTLENEVALARLRNTIRQRKPYAFHNQVHEQAANSKSHITGCRCSKSKCVKKYCECFSASVFCSHRCRCLNCHNVRSTPNNLNNATAPDPVDESVLELIVREML